MNDDYELTMVFDRATGLLWVPDTICLVLGAIMAVNDFGAYNGLSTVVFEISMDWVLR